MLSPLQIDFVDPQNTTRQSKKEEVIAHKVDSQVDLFNRLAYNHNVVLVHCAMGVSRSASCVIMYVMKKFKLDFEDTLEFVKNKRHVVDPNEGFVKHLQEF